MHVDSTRVGGHAFLEEFMVAQCDDFRRRLNTLVALVQRLGPSSGALHASLRVLRASLLQRHQHIVRSVPWPVLHPWAVRLDAMILEHLSLVLDLLAWTPAALASLRAPLDWYGLGIFPDSGSRVMLPFGLLALQALDGNQVLDNACPCIPRLSKLLLPSMRS